MKNHLKFSEQSGKNPLLQPESNNKARSTTSTEEQVKPVTPNRRRFLKDMSKDIETKRNVANNA
jgi:hypothetical protein